jgi:hypothetical protein
MLKWSPKEDITAYELALCMGLVIANAQRHGHVMEEYEKLPDSAKRHFEDLRAKKEEKE